MNTTTRKDTRGEIQRTLTKIENGKRVWLEWVDLCLDDELAIYYALTEELGFECTEYEQESGDAIFRKVIEESSWGSIMQICRFDGKYKIIFGFSHVWVVSRHTLFDQIEETLKTAETL
jgi:hypothetical protein